MKMWRPGIRTTSAAISLSIVATALAQEDVSQQLRDLKSKVDQLESDRQDREWDEMERQHQRRMQEIQAEWERQQQQQQQLGTGRLQEQKFQVLELLKSRQPSASAAVHRFIDGEQNCEREMKKRRPKGQGRW